MATVSFACIHEETIANVQGRKMSLVVSDEGENAVYRRVRTIRGEEWEMLREFPTFYEPYVSGYSAAVEWAERVADGLEPCPQPVRA